MVRGIQAASSYGLLGVWMSCPCCPLCQLLAVFQRSKSWREPCEVPALTATRRASSGQGGISWPLLLPAGQVGLLLQVVLP